MMAAGVYVAALVLGLLLVSSQPGGQMTSGFVLVALGGGAIGAVALRNRRPDIAYGLACGVAAAILVPFVLFIAIVGICSVMGVKILG